MITYLILIISVLLGGFGIFLFIRNFHQSRQILLGSETSRSVMIKVAIRLGLGFNLGFLSLELFFAGLDKNLKWTVETVLVMILLPLIGNLILTLGSLWQYFIVGKYRGLINKKK